jgi:hypothetical protein
MRIYKILRDFKTSKSSQENNYCITYYLIRQREDKTRELIFRNKLGIYLFKFRLKYSKYQLSDELN